MDITHKGSVSYFDTHHYTKPSCGVSCIVCFIINDTKIQNFPVSYLLLLLHVDAIATMSTYSLVPPLVAVFLHIDFLPADNCLGNVQPLLILDGDEFTLQIYGAALCPLIYFSSDEQENI